MSDGPKQMSIFSPGRRKRLHLNHTGSIDDQE